MKGRACWYPQMGGYVGKAVALSSGGGACCEVYVWHDGEFPFSYEDGDTREPVYLHHCVADQFIEFGKLLTEVSGDED